MDCRNFMLMKIESIIIVIIIDHGPSEFEQITILGKADVELLVDFKTLSEAICGSYLWWANIKLVKHLLSLQNFMGFFWLRAVEKCSSLFYCFELGKNGFN